MSSPTPDPSTAASSSSPLVPHRSRLDGDSRAALLSLSPPGSQRQRNTPLKRHSRRLSQVTMKMETTELFQARQALKRTSLIHTNTSTNTNVSLSNSNGRSNEAAMDVDMEEASSGKASSNSHQATTSGAPIRSISDPLDRSLLQSPMGVVGPSKNLIIDTTRNDPTIESHLSPQVIENIERNMRRASQESASPTVNSKTRPVSGDDKSITSSFSLSFLPDEAPVVTRNREEDCASLEHSPHHPSHSPASFEPISPMSSNTSSLHIGIIGVDGVVGGGGGGGSGVVGVDGIPRRRSLHVPDFSMSDSNFQLLSPSHVSSGWDGPPSQSKLQQPTSSEGTTPLTNLSPETSPIMSPTSQKKEKVKSSWKFWKKNKEKLKEIDGNGMVDVESMSSPTMSDSSLASSSPPVTRPNPIATMPTPITMPMQVKSQAQKAATMPIPNHTTNINTIHTTTAMTAAMNDTSVSINNNDTNRQQMSPAIPARPKVSTPKNKLSPKGGSTGREGVHKRQKSHRGDDVHSPRSGGIVSSPGFTTAARQPAQPAILQSPPPSTITQPTKTNATSNINNGSQTQRGERRGDVPPSTSANTVPRKDSSSNRGSQTSRKSHKDLPMDIDDMAILASLISSGLIESPEPDSPKTPEPTNSYVDSAWELPETIKARPFPRAVIRPSTSSWTRTVFSPHPILNPSVSSSTSTSSSRTVSTCVTPVLGSPAPSAPGSPKRMPVPPRSSSMIVYASPTCVANLSVPSSPNLTSILLPPSIGSAVAFQAPSELRQIISGHSLGYLLFLRHLQREYASESLLFWKAAEDLLPLAAREVQDGYASASGSSSTKNDPTSTPRPTLGFSRIYLSIYQRYLKPGASHEINISSSLRDLLRKDAEGHQEVCKAYQTNHGESNVQRNPEALHQSSLVNLDKIEQPSDEVMEGAVLVANPLLAAHPSSSPDYPQPTRRLSQPHAPIGSTGMTIGVDTIVPPLPSSLIGAPLTASPQLALSTYVHLLQSQVEIEKLLIHDCLPRFKHSPSWERLKRHIDLTGGEVKPSTSEAAPASSLSSSSSPPSRENSGGPSNTILQTMSTTGFNGGINVEKRKSCLLPTSLASSFTTTMTTTTTASEPSSLQSSPSQNGNIVGVVPTPLALGANASTVAGSTVGRSAGGIVGVTGPTPSGIGGGVFGVAVSNMSHSNPSVMMHRTRTIGASVFAEAAAMANRHRQEEDQARTRSKTQGNKTNTIEEAGIETGL